MNYEPLKQTIEEHFAKLLNTHMAKSLMLNSALRVEAVGFCEWEDNHLCVVITPWFMSLFLVPTKDNAPDNGSIRNHLFKSGSYAFTAAKDELIGNYETCTLFTSMSNFTSHSQARDVALETIRLLLGQEKPAHSHSSAESLKAPNKRALFRSAIRRGKNT